MSSLKVELSDYFQISQSPPLRGIVQLEGAKNAVLVIMASLLLTSGRSTLRRVPPSLDVYQMIHTLEALGAVVDFYPEERILIVDTTGLHGNNVPESAMRAMRASTLVMGPLLARHGRVELALPGGCVLGTRSIDLHLRSFQEMGAAITITNNCVQAVAPQLRSRKFIFDYPSVGATENIMMAASLIPATTTIVNAALEPEVFDLITVLRKMGATIDFEIPGTIHITGTTNPQPVDHTIIPDRLEAGTFLVAAAVTGGTITIPQAQPSMMELFLEKLRDMGHHITIGTDGTGITLEATTEPLSVSFKTMPYPGFPTDLQAPMMVAQVRATGTSTIYETVFEQRVSPHVSELKKMGAQIDLTHAMSAIVHGNGKLQGAAVVAPDIRGAAALVIAGLAAEGTTHVHGLHHIRRGYVDFEKKLAQLGAPIRLISAKP